MLNAPSALPRSSARRYTAPATQANVPVYRALLDPASQGVVLNFPRSPRPPAGAAASRQAVAPLDSQPRPHPRGPPPKRAFDYGQIESFSCPRMTS